MYGISRLNIITNYQNGFSKLLLCYFSFPLQCFRVINIPAYTYWHLILSGWFYFCHSNRCVVELYIFIFSSLSFLGLDMWFNIFYITFRIFLAIISSNTFSTQFLLFWFWASDHSYVTVFDVVYSSWMLFYFSSLFYFCFSVWLFYIDSKFTDSFLGSYEVYYWTYRKQSSFLLQ